MLPLLLLLLLLFLTHFVVYFHSFYFVIVISSDRFFYCHWKTIQPKQIYLREYLFCTKHVEETTDRATENEKKKLSANNSKWQWLVGELATAKPNRMNWKCARRHGQQAQNVYVRARYVEYKGAYAIHALIAIQFTFSVKLNQQSDTHTQAHTYTTSTHTEYK